MRDILHYSESVVERDDWLLEISIPNLPNLFPVIPNQYWVIWSWARQLLELQLGLRSDYPILRDFDIVRLWEEDYLWQDDELAREYMPDDFNNGNGVKTLDDNYFPTRDLTMNEVYYSNWKLVFTRACFEDISNSIIRLTRDTYDSRYWNHYYKNVLKALRVFVERKDEFPLSRVEFITPNQLEDTYRNLFWIALNLDKAAFSWIADKFLKLLQEIWFFPKHLKTPIEARKFIEDSWEVYSFNFKYLGDDFDFYAEFSSLLDDYEYEEYVVGDRVLEILDWLHPHKVSNYKGWKRR